MNSSKLLLRSQLRLIKGATGHLLALLMLFSPITSLAESVILDESFVLDGNEYILYSNGDASLKSVCSVGFLNYAYDECTIPESFDVGGQTYTVTSIERSAFRWSVAKTVHLPETIKAIASSAFAQSMTSTVNIPEGCSLYANAFQNSDLKELTIPASTELIIGEASFPFYGLQKLLNIFVEESHPKFKDVDGVFCSHDGSLLKYPEARSGVYVVPEGITNIEPQAFMYSNLDKIVFSEGVENVRANVIGQYDDYVKFSAKEITPKALEVYVGSTVKQFSANFALNPEINKSVDVFFFSEEPPVIGLNCSWYLYQRSRLTIHVPCGCRDVYASELSKGNSGHIVEIVEMERGTDLKSFGLTTAEIYRTDTYNQRLDVRWPLVFFWKIPYFIISGADGPEAAVAAQRFGHKYPNLVVPEYAWSNGISYPVTVIDDEAFQGLNGGSAGLKVLPTTIHLNSRIRRIGVRAFESTCLSSIILPEYLKEIDSKAFLDTPTLREVFCLAKTPPACSEDAWYKSWTHTFHGADDHYDVIEYGPSGVDRILYVPMDAIELYKVAPVWKDFSRIVALGTDKIDALRNAVGNPDSHSSCYDLQGRLAQQPLQPGVYIQNGRKFVVK